MKSVRTYNQMVLFQIKKISCYGYMAFRNACSRYSREHAHRVLLPTTCTPSTYFCKLYFVLARVLLVVLCPPLFDVAVGRPPSSKVDSGWLLIVISLLESSLIAGDFVVQKRASNLLDAHNWNPAATYSPGPWEAEYHGR